MDSKQAREVFDSAIASTNDADQIARMELCREFFCNPEFRAALSQYSYEATK